MLVQKTHKHLLQHHSLKASILRHSAFFMVQLSHPYVTTGKTIALTIKAFVGKVMLFNMLSRFVITFFSLSSLLDNFVTLHDFPKLRFLDVIPSISDIIPCPLPLFIVLPFLSPFSWSHVFSWSRSLTIHFCPTTTSLGRRFFSLQGSDYLRETVKLSFAFACFLPPPLRWSCPPRPHPTLH